LPLIPAHGKNYVHEPGTYRFSKMVAEEKSFRGPVWAYLTNEKTNGRIFKGASPSYSEQEWHTETAQVNKRIAALQGEWKQCPVFITVGALVANKNQQYIFECI